MISELPSTATEREITQLDAAAQDMKGHAAHIHDEIAALADCLTKTMLTSDNTTVRRAGDKAMPLVTGLLTDVNLVDDLVVDYLERERDRRLKVKAREKATR